MKSKTYKTKIQNSTFEVNADQLSEAQLKAFTEKEFHFRYKNENYNIEVESFNINTKVAVLLVNNQKFEVEIEDELDALIEQMGLNANAVQKLENIKSPMPGLILDVLVKPGDEIEKGSKLLVLEAMKMENILLAEGEGIVKSIEIQKGTTVDKGAVLIEME